MKPAGYLKRTGAAIIDLIIVTIGTSAIGWPFLKLMNYEERLAQIQRFTEEAAQHPNDVEIDPALLQAIFVFMFALLALLLVLLLVMHAYYVFYEASASGQTLGKKVFGLRVVDVASGGRITRTQAIYREALRWYVDGLFLLPAIIAMGVTPLRQRVGDLAAKTMVVEVPRKLSEEPAA